MNILESVDEVVSNYGRFDKGSCIVTDGARGMIGNATGIVGNLK